MIYAREQEQWWAGFRAGAEAAVTYLVDEYPGLGIGESYDDDQPSPRDEAVAHAANVANIALSALSPAPSDPKGAA